MTESRPPPPPPPPPPPGVISSKPCFPPVTTTLADKKGIFHDNVSSSQGEQAKKAYHQFLKEKWITDDEVGDSVFISSYKPVKPVIQNGPLCGMVALAMASQLIGRDTVSTEDVFEEAKKCHYTYQGEMFSASYMQDLALKFMDADVKLVELNPSGHFSYQQASSIVIQALLQNNHVLLPYDADKNHGPCLAGGHKAHWALVTGFFTVVSKRNVGDDLCDFLTQDEQIKCLHYWNGRSHSDFDDKEFVQFLSDNSDFHIFCHQGKSKYCGTWNLKDMLESNNNLLEVGPDRNPEEYLLPPDGVEGGLRCKAVFVSQRNR